MADTAVAITAGTGSGSSTSESHSGSTWSCSATETRQADNWKIRPCVTDPTGPQQFSDAYPGSGTWLNTIDGTRMPVSWSSIDEPPTYSTGATASDPTDRQVYGPDGSCWDVAEANEVLPLTSDKSRILQKIDRLEAFGATSGALGTAWAWYMLSPEWGSIFGSASRPGAYSDTQSSGSSPPALRKIAVLMSDGVFNTYRGWKDHDEADLAQRAKTLCANMKAKGIEIYTVGFDLDSLPSDRQARAIDTLKSCGSDLSHFYNAVDVEALRGAFRDIGTKVAVLRIAE